MYQILGPQNAGLYGAFGAPKANTPLHFTYRFDGGVHDGPASRNGLVHYAKPWTGTV
jgi:hypothetical protein